MAGSSRAPPGRGACCSLLPSCKSRTTRALLTIKSCVGGRASALHTVPTKPSVFGKHGDTKASSGGPGEVTACAEPPLLRCPRVSVAPVLLFRAQKIPRAGPGAPVQPLGWVPKGNITGRRGEAFTQCSACKHSSLPVAEPSTCWL